MKPIKVLAVASMGGHLIQLMRLKPVFDQYDVHYVSSQQRPGMEPFTAITDANRNAKWRLLLLFFQILWLVVRLRPNVIISSGAAPGYFAMMVGKLMGARTLWIDSIANAEELSLSGQKAGTFADLWLTQWPEVAAAHQANKTKANTKSPSYGGRVL